MSSAIPVGWFRDRLSSVVSLQYGKSPNDVKDSSGQYPIIGTSGVVGSATTYLCKETSVVIGRKGTINKPIYIDTPFWAIDTTYYCKISTKTDPKWFFFNVCNEGLEKHNEASGVPSLSRDTLNLIQLSIPPLPEQKKIASILTSVDEVIENTQKQIDKLQDLKKATMNELLTKGIGHTEFKDSELGQIPKSWEVLPLAKVCEVSSSKRVMQSDYVDKGVPFYRSKEIILKSKGKTVQSILYISEEQFLNLSSRFGAPESGDILITAVGTIGVCYLVGHERFYFKDGNILWLKNIEALAPSFLSVLLSNHRTRERIIEISGGSSQSALTIEKLSDFLVPVPSKYEQEKLSQIATSLDERIDSQKHKLHQTQSLKKSLMQDLLTGKVRVTVN
jgi:type I restriction enzyme S subunit